MRGHSKRIEKVFLSTPLITWGSCCSLIHYLLVIFHWNGCLYHIVYKNNGFGSKNWVFGDHDSGDVVKQYLQSYYWCTLALTTIGKQ